LRLVACKISGEPISPALSRWLEGVPQKLRRRFVEIGLLDPERASGGKPLAEHLADFRASLQAKGNTPAYVELTTSRIGKVFEGCGFVYLSDISASRIQQYLANLHNNGAGISRQSFNYYLQAVKQFFKWLVQDRRASESPVQHLKGLNVRTDRRHDRRALSTDEIRRLLETTTAEPERFGMNGAVRAMLYRLAVETGLRANELRTLKISSFDFDNCSVVVEAAYSKHRRRDVVGRCRCSPENSAEHNETQHNRIDDGTLYSHAGRTGERSGGTTAGLVVAQ